MEGHKYYSAYSSRREYYASTEFVEKAAAEIDPGPAVPPSPVVPAASMLGRIAGTPGNPDEPHPPEKPRR